MVFAKTERTSLDGFAVYLYRNGQHGSFLCTEAADTMKTPRALSPIEPPVRECSLLLGGFSLHMDNAEKKPKVIGTGQRTASQAEINTYCCTANPGNVNPHDPDRSRGAGHWNLSLFSKAESDRRVRRISKSNEWQEANRNGIGERCAIGGKMLVGFKAQNHPQQTRYAGSERHVDDRALPQADFEKLNARFGFTVDAAAAEHNAKLPRYWSEETSGLEASWKNERVYCNPPYSSIEPWCLKAWQEREAELIVMLLPANRTEQRWWQNQIEPFRDRALSPLTTEFLPGRLRFLKPGQTEIGPNERPPFGIVLCIWERT